MCPDSAIPGLVSEIKQVFGTVVKRLKKQGKSVQYISPVLPALEKNVRNKIDTGDVSYSFLDHLKFAIKEITKSPGLQPEEKRDMEAEFQNFWSEIKECTNSLLPVLFTTAWKKRKRVQEVY